MEAQAGLEQAKPPQIGVICRNIDELVEAVLASTNPTSQQHITHPDDASLRLHQAATLKTFKELMVEIQSKAAKAIHEVEMKFAQTDVPLQDLPGIEPGGELNRILGCTQLSGKQGYKLRDFNARLPASIVVPKLITGDDATQLPHGESHVVVLKPTLRNVWVIQHAYAKLMNYKENLVKQYLSSANLEAGASRKFSREYYEDLGLANLPSKNKLGNLLDVSRLSYNHAAHDIMIILVYLTSDGGLQYVEAVTGNIVNMDAGSSDSYLVLPMSEASIKKLYDVYRSLRKATSEQRRASRDKEFAAKMPVDEVDELQKQFNFTGGEDTGGSMGGKKRRRMLEDDDGRD
ncbi:hypothetical protein F4779DRAFT_578417 [Xylariaceae sp. FL0662B]|nr:hypothetical protein F4779DRAFT_578417 [Xylariaceae sp. FL0662B]